MATVPTVTEDLLAEAEGLGDLMVELRRDLHRHPELGLDNPRTQQRIVDALAGLGVEVSTGTGLSSVVATIEGERPGPSVVLRADTDALPMDEDHDWEHRSQEPGRAHLCGHDSHVAMLVGAAHLLAARRADLRGVVRLAFQPGEEGQGGMRLMLDEGLLEVGGAEPEMAFAIHVTPNLPVGYVGGRAGPLMAATDDFRVVVRGSGGHASQPHLANDPIPVAAEIVTALQTLVTRHVDAFDPAVVTVARITAGSTSNVIPESAELEGTIRTVSERTRGRVREGFTRVVEGIAAAHGCSVEVDLVENYPVTVNDRSVFDHAVEVVERVLGENTFLPFPSPVMGAEDVSYLFQRVPGAMVFLGVCPDDIADSLSAPACHSNRMRLNEAALPMGAALHAAMALTWPDR